MTLVSDDFVARTAALIDAGRLRSGCLTISQPGDPWYDLMNEEFRIWQAGLPAPPRQQYLDLIEAAIEVALKHAEREAGLA